VVGKTVGHFTTKHQVPSSYHLTPYENSIEKYLK
jgi:hypothetical protein